MTQAPPSDQGDRWPGRTRSGWVATGAFVLGLLAGVLLAGLLGQDPPVAPVAQEAEPTASLPGSPPTAVEGTDGTRVNEACLRAINAAQDIAAAVEDLGTAAAALDAAQLDEAIRRLQPLQERLRAATAACEVASGSPPSEPPTASPTASPTD